MWVNACINRDADSMLMMKTKANSPVMSIESSCFGDLADSRVSTHDMLVNVPFTHGDVERITRGGNIMGNPSGIVNFAV